MKNTAAADVPRLQILLVDPDLNSHHLTFNLLKQHHEVFDILRAGDALDMLRKGNPVVNVIIVNVLVPDEKSDKDHNFLVANICREFGVRIPIVVLSEHPGAYAFLGKETEGSFVMLKKPVDDMIFDTLTTIVSYRAFTNIPGDVAATGSASDAASSGQKRKNHLWNDELHQSFLTAVDAEGGLNIAKPAGVLKKMGLERLTREQVASHLQYERKKAKMVLVGQDK